jgi:hypothetical protein
MAQGLHGIQEPPGVIRGFNVSFMQFKYNAGSVSFPQEARNF